MGHPVKEGLRQYNSLVSVTLLSPQSGSSSKRGIKTVSIMLSLTKLKSPRVGHPVKEGLRRCDKDYCLALFNPRVGHPVKEGLRQFNRIKHN